MGISIGFDVLLQSRHNLGKRTLCNYSPMSDFAIPAPLQASIQQFNQKQFYECHDSLEALWMESSEAEKNLYQGILQVAVAFYHLGNHNWQGAVTLLGEGRRRLLTYPSNYMGLDLETFITEVNEILMQLQQAGAAHIEQIAQHVQPPTLNMRE